MPITRFRIQDPKCQLAECENVPPIMVVAGPNGVGKSTLLFCLAGRAQGPMAALPEEHTKVEVERSGEVLSLGPHRVWLSGPVRQVWLFEREVSFRQAMAQHQNPHLPGVGSGRERDPSSADEVPAAMKYSLAQLERRRQGAIAKLVDLNKGRFPTGECPDPYQPLRAMTSQLLPHLQFDRIDFANLENVRCIWRRQLAGGQYVEVDIDQLSSGEKEVLCLLMPFVEHEAQRILKSIEAGDAEPSAVIPAGDVVVLVDEPELHLHPALQVRLMDYMRSRVAQGGVQFILATHSPTLMNAANFDELYVLMPPSTLGGNQLVRVASDADRLDALRDLLGETYLATLSRSIVCVEGAVPTRGSREPSDARILAVLCPEISDLVLLPTGGRSNTIATAQKLREALSRAPAGASVFALVDADDEEPAVGDDWMLSLPAAEIENMLLVPRVIAGYLAPHAEKLPSGIQPCNDDVVDRALKGIARGHRDMEVATRLRRRMRTATDFAGRTIQELRTELQGRLGGPDKALPSLEDFDQRARKLEEWADTVLAQGKELVAFSGKEILREFYVRFLSKAGFGSYQNFVYEVARHAGKDEQTRKAVAAVAFRIAYYLPARLPGLLEQLRDSVAASTMAGDFTDVVNQRTGHLLETLSKALGLREAGKPNGSIHAEVRREALAIARSVQEKARDTGRGPAEMKEQLEAVVEAAREIGTGPFGT